MKYTQTKWQYFGIPFGILFGSAKAFLHALLGQNHLFRILLVLSPMKQAHGAILPSTATVCPVPLHETNSRKQAWLSILVFWGQSRDGGKMRNYELEPPYMDFLCYTMIRTVAPGIPLIYHLVFPEKDRRNGYCDIHDFIWTISHLLCHPLQQENGP